jgi:hypothetical protein
MVVDICSDKYHKRESSIRICSHKVIKVEGGRFVLENLNIVQFRILFLVGMYQSAALAPEWSTGDLLQLHEGND